MNQWSREGPGRSHWSLVMAARRRRARAKVAKPGPGTATATAESPGTWHRHRREAHRDREPCGSARRHAWWAASHPVFFLKLRHTHTHNHKLTRLVHPVLCHHFTLLERSGATARHVARARRSVEQIMDTRSVRPRLTHLRLNKEERCACPVARAAAGGLSPSDTHTVSSGCHAGRMSRFPPGAPPSLRDLACGPHLQPPASTSASR